MATFDLKPLSQETIDKMAFNNHDLWMVKIGEDIQGPFESQSLKHYATENEELFKDAVATRLDKNDYRPFRSHPLFQRRTPEVLTPRDQNQGPFWTLDEGQKHGPFSYMDIDKKIEMGLLVMTDHLSVDNGDTWKKIYEFSGFDRRTHSADELPVAPLEASFQQAKLAIVAKLEKPHVNTQEELASLAHQGQMQGKVLTLKLDEMTMQNLKHTEVSDSLMWAIPGAAAFFMALMVGGYFLLTPSNETGAPDLVAKSGTQTVLETPVGEVPASNTPSAGIRVTQRRPASVRPNISHRPTPAITSRFPTRVETHMREERLDEQPYEREPDSTEPIEPPAAQEHSLVGNGNEGQDQSLDAAMNGVVQPAEPVVEEASDF